MTGTESETKAANREKRTSENLDDRNRKKQMLDENKIKSKQQQSTWYFELSDLMFSNFKKNNLEKIAATVKHLDGCEDSKNCVTYQFELSRVSGIYDRQEISHLAKSKSYNYNDDEKVPAFVVLYIPSLKKFKEESSDRFNELITDPIKVRFQKDAHDTIDKSLDIDQKALILLHQYFSFNKYKMDYSTIHVCIFDFTPNMEEIFISYRATIHETCKMPFTTHPFFINYAKEGEGNGFG